MAGVLIVPAMSAAMPCTRSGCPGFSVGHAGVMWLDPGCGSLAWRLLQFRVLRIPRLGWRSGGVPVVMTMILH